jgi:hypothetical protein
VSQFDEPPRNLSIAALHAVIAYGGAEGRTNWRALE